MSHLRVLHVQEPPDGGVAEHVARLAEGLAVRGHEVRVAGPEDARVRPAAVSGAEFRPVPFARGYRDPRREVAAARALAAIVRSEPFDLVHAHSTKAGVLARLVARRAGLACVYTPHCYAFIGDVSTSRRAFATAVERALSPLTARTICVSRAERDEALRRRVGRPERLSVVHNGVDPCPEVEPAPALLPWREKGVLVGVVAVHRRQKGIDRLISAAPQVLARCPDVRIAIVGNGPLLDHHRRQAELMRVGDRLGFFPFAPPAAQFLRAMDVFVLPSRYEGLPIAVLEAMACGVPVVATDVGGTAETLGTDAGVLVPNGDEGALVDAVVRLADSASLREGLGERARARAREQFTIDRMVDRTAAVYAAVLGRDVHDRSRSRTSVATRASGTPSSRETSR